MRHAALLVSIATVLAGCGEAEPPHPKKNVDPFAVPDPPPGPPPLIYDTEDADASEIYRTPSAQINELPKAIQDWTALQDMPSAGLSTAVAALDPKLRQYEKAARARRCDWKYAQPLTFGSDLSHATAAIKAARALSARAHVRYAQGRVDAAIDDILTTVRIGSDLLLDRTLIAHLVGVVCAAIAVDTFKTTVLRRGLEPERLRRVEAHVKAVLARFPAFERSIECEKRCTLGSVDEVVTRGLAGLLAPVSVPPFVDDVLKSDPDFARRTLSARLEECYGLLIQDAREPLYSKRLRFDSETFKSSASRGLEKCNAGSEKAEAIRAIADFMFALLAPSVAAAKRNFAHARVALDGLLLWCAVALERHARGAYPAALPRPSVDPWDGGPLKYERVGDRAFVITTAGPGGDWRERIKALAECRFDGDAFAKRHADLAPCTIWSSR